MSFAAASSKSLWRLLLLLGAILFWSNLMGRAGPAAAVTFQAGSGLMLNEIMAANTSTNLDPDYGNFADWIEIYNAGAQDVDLGGYTITDNIRNPVRWTLPGGTTVPAGGYLLVWADGRAAGAHTNFGLSRDGEEVTLYDAQGRLVDRVRFGAQVADVSYGRTRDAAPNWGFFQQPTPGGANSGPTLNSAAQVPAPQFSHPGGRYSNPLELTLSVPHRTAEIHYTLDGSPPTTASPLYQEPVRLSESAVIRARAFAPGLLASPLSTTSYIMGEQTSLPIVSLAIDPTHLWNPDTGIYLDENVESRIEWERPATIALYETDGSSGFQAEVAVRLFGTSAIYLPQKSLSAFVTDAGRGAERLAYALFPDHDQERYSSFLLRSASDDWAGAMLRDAFAHEALRGQVDLGLQAYRPALLFLNGRYFGIHNIREKQNEDYLVTNYGAVLEQLDLLFVGHNHTDGRSEIQPLFGSAADYEQLEAFALNNDLTLPENYSYIQDSLNSEHFMDYIIVESYTGNTSWHRNRKLWRAQPPLDRWEFLIYDLDRGFGHPFANTLQDIMTYDPLFSALLANQSFREQFIQRFAHRINVTFEPHRLSSLLDRLQEPIAPEIERQRAFWQVAGWWADNYESEALNSGRPPQPDLPAWESEIAYLHEYVGDRPDAVRQHIVEAFSLSGTQRLTLDVSDPRGGHILVEGLPIPAAPFTGAYFRDVPLQLTAVPQPGYRFTGWRGAADGGDSTLSLLLTGNETITAVFEPAGPFGLALDPRLPRTQAAAFLLIAALAALVQYTRRRHL